LLIKNVGKFAAYNIKIEINDYYINQINPHFKEELLTLKKLKFNIAPGDFKTYPITTIGFPLPDKDCLKLADYEMEITGSYDGLKKNKEIKEQLKICDFLP